MLKTIVMTTFDRDCLLQLGLESIRRWNPNVEILVVNDGVPGNVENICRLFNAIHLFTGYRNKEKMHWRVPGYALNIGVKKAKGDIIFLTCAEMWHVTDCVNPMAEAVEKDLYALAIPEGKDDMDNRYLPNLDNEEKYAECVPLKTELPFLMAMYRDRFVEIGGYDEDFVGQSFDDDDLVERLQANGCHYQKVDARCVHLYHPRYCHDKRTMGRWAINKKLYEQRKGQIVRNVNREWGVL
jgi:glycosyltransferase involved in cell wall biosynthesis